MSTQILSGVIVGVVVAVAGAIVSHLLIMQREGKRWEREDQKQREAFKREDQYRDYAERREAYAQFLAAWDRIYIGGDRSGEALRALSQTQMTVRLITHSNEVRMLADVLFHNGSEYVNIGDPDELRRWKGNDERILLDFVDDAREELGKPKLRKPNLPSDRATDDAREGPETTTSRPWWRRLLEG